MKGESALHSPLTAEQPCSPGASARGRRDRECRRRHTCTMALCASGAGVRGTRISAIQATLRAERWGQGSSSASTTHPLPGGQQLLVRHLLRVVRNRKHASQ